MNDTLNGLRPLALEDIQPEHFEAALGATFELAPSEIPGVAPLPLVLLEVRRLSERAGFRETAFTLLFGGPALPGALPPVLYDLRGAGVQVASVFLSRVSVFHPLPDEEPPEAFYEAVFS